MRTSAAWSILLPTVLAALVASAALACSGSTTLDTTGDGGSGDGSTTDATSSDGGIDLVPADTTSIVVTEKGGFGVGAPAGSSCTMADTTYTITLPSRDLTWKICEATDSGPYAFVTGQKTLTETDYAPVATALHALARATKTGCGADKAAEQAVVTTPSQQVTYIDAFYFCDATDTKTFYVTGLDDVLSALRNAKE